MRAGVGGAARGGLGARRVGGARGGWAGRAAGPRSCWAGRALGPRRSPLPSAQGGVYGPAASRAGAGPEAAAAPCAGEEPGAGGRAAGGDSGPRRGVPERRRRRRQRRLSRLGAWVRGGSGSARGLRCERAARLLSSPARRRRCCDWVEDGVGRMEILMTVSKFASICTMVGAAGGPRGRPRDPCGRAAAARPLSPPLAPAARGA